MSTTASNGMKPNLQSQQMESFRLRGSSNDPLTTYFGTKVSDTDRSIHAGVRGPAVLEDFHNREKISHFDHERMPERVVHARGAAAFGQFKLHTPLTGLTTAKILLDVDQITPTIARFSTVGGFRGSADTVRDPRGFAVRFYTSEGNWDIVGNNMPVFFIQDAIKFPDLVHALKPEPHNEIPQAQSAHDNAWDFMSLHEQSTHMQMWHLSDRALPRSYRMMQGFGVHTFRLINADGKSTFVKYHWTPHLGTHSLLWDECLKIGGQDPDFHRRDLWDAIEAGALPSWELGVQLVPEEDEHKFDFDLLDATKIIPEDLVPVKNIGTMTLNRNPVDYFAEVEQVAFGSQHIVPGMDFTSDPLLAGRNFSYQDTQLSRIGVNFADIPVNRPVCPFANNLQDGKMQMFSRENRTRYHPNRNDALSLSNRQEGGFTPYPESVSGVKERMRAPKFNEFVNQATLFYNSMSPVEKAHLVSAGQFELGKCTEHRVQQAAIDRYNLIDHGFALAVAEAFPRVKVPNDVNPNHGKKSAYLSQHTGKSQVFTARGRKMGVYVLNGCDDAWVQHLEHIGRESGMIIEYVSDRNGPLQTSRGASISSKHTFETSRSTFFDALCLIGGDGVAYHAGFKSGRLVHAVREAYMHLKTVVVCGKTVKEFVAKICLPDEFDLKAKGESLSIEHGVLFVDSVNAVGFAEELVGQVAKHRVWDRDVSMVAA